MDTSKLDTIYQVEQSPDSSSYIGQRNRRHSRKIGIGLVSSTIIAILTAIAIVFPPIRTFEYYNQLCILLTALWLIIALINRPSFFIKMPLHRIIVLFYILYTSIVPYFFDNPTIGHRFLSLALIPIFYVMYEYYTLIGVESHKKAIIYYSIPFILITCTLTGIALINSPYLARSIKSSGEDSIQLWAQGIGGYDHIYLLVMLFSILLYICLNQKIFKISIIARVIFIVVLLFTGIVIILSNFFTALIMLLIAIFGFIILKKQSAFKGLLLILILAIITISGKDLVLFSIDNSIGIIGQGRTADRLTQIRDAMTGASDDADLTSDRVTTLQSSLTAFADNPLLGIITKPITEKDGLLDGFGQHSQFLDTFALFGLLIGLIQIYIILQPFIIRLKQFSQLRNFTFVMMILTFVIFTFNNVTPSIGFAIFFIFPVIYDLLKKRINLLRFTQ